MFLGVNSILSFQFLSIKGHFDKIALEEGCTYQCVQRSVYRAVEKIKNILKNL